MAAPIPRVGWGRARFHSLWLAWIRLLGCREMQKGYGDTRVSQDPTKDSDLYLSYRFTVQAQPTLQLTPMD
jgi:hypothetical protein